jgi:hypothetical protein
MTLKRVPDCLATRRVFPASFRSSGNFERNRITR